MVQAGGSEECGDQAWHLYIYKEKSAVYVGNENIRSVRYWYYLNNF